MPTILKTKNSVITTVAPTTLQQGELAVNITDKKMWVGNAATTPVQILGTGAGGGAAAGSNTQVQYNSSGALAGDADFTFNGTTVTMANDASISGLTVGKGGGAVASNTVVGASAMNSGSQTGTNNSAFGNLALNGNTSGANNTGIGFYAIGAGTVTGSSNTGVGTQALFVNSSGASNSAFGVYSLLANTTGANNTAIGENALRSNTTASNNTAVGYQAGYSTTTSVNNVFIGTQAGYLNTTNSFNTFVGQVAGYNTTGPQNTFVGSNSGNAVTTGSKHAILGSYTGNGGGLDIRTASNYIVLSDGDGNPVVYVTGNANAICKLNAPSGNRFVQHDFSIATVSKSSIYWDNTNTNLYVVNASGGVYLTNTGTSWTSNSDERLKENLVPIENGLSKVCSLRSVIGNFIADETKKPTPFLIAQDIQAVLPEAVTTSTLKDDATNTEYLGVAYTETIPLLVAAIKELNAKVETLEAQLKGN